MNDKIKKAQNLLHELRELMKDPEVFNRIGESFFDRDGESPYADLTELVTEKDYGELIHVSCGVYFSSLLVTRIAGGPDDDDSYLYNDDAVKWANKT